ncbi:hypothetical protein [Arthrobacter sp. NPDC092385]|uniref:hypothetical protein n=1 Tax=Arthrobacter sp. NPDC092385 TaxID=3363943 RepID=UPI0037F74CD7
MPIHSTPVDPAQHQGGGAAHPESEALPGAGASGTAAPLLDPGVLRDMEGDFADPSVVGRFARDFSSTLEQKIDRLDQRMRAGDASGTEDAVLSVTTSAAMAGAVRLGHAALATQRLIATDGLDGARRSMPLLRACAADTIHALQDLYPERPSE